MININLIAERRAKKIREMRVIQGSTAGVILLALIMCVLNFTAWHKKNQVQQALSTVNANLDALEGQRQQLQKITAEINEKKPVVELLRQVRVSEGAWMTILADLSDITPTDVAVGTIATTVRNDGVQLRISGFASDEDMVGQFMLSFSEQTRWAKKPELGMITAEKRNQDTATNVRFDLTIPVQGMLGGDL